MARAESMEGGFESMPTDDRSRALGTKTEEIAGFEGSGDFGFGQAVKTSNRERQAGNLQEGVGLSFIVPFAPAAPCAAWDARAMRSQCSPHRVPPWARQRCTCS